MKKSILKGTLVLTVIGAAALTSCTKEGEGKDVRNKVSSDEKEQKADSHEGKCGGMKKDDGSAKSIEHKCGEGKCGEGKCGGAEKASKTIDNTVSDVKEVAKDVEGAAKTTANDIENAAKDIKKEVKAH